MIPSGTRDVLGYEQPAAERARPAALVVVGIVSVIVGLAMVGLGLGGVWTAFHYWKLARPAMATVPPPPATRLTPYDGDPVGTRGFKRARRDVAAATVRARFGETMGPDREAMFRRLLGEYGQDIFPSRSTTEAALRGAVIESGQLPAGPDGFGRAGTIWFRTAAGLVWLDDAHARFRSEGSGDVAWVDRDTVTDVYGGRWRNSVSLSREMVAVHRKTNGQVNSIQAAGLAQHLRTVPPASNFAWVGGGGPLTEGWSVIGFGVSYEQEPTASMEGSTLRFGTRRLVFADGRTTLLPPPPGPPPAAIGLPLGTRVPMSMAVPAIAETLVRGALGAWLVGCGVAALVGSSRAARHHVMWACASIAVTAGTITYALALLGDVNALSDGMTALAWGIVAGLTYPMIVLAVIKGGRIRTYFEGIRGAAVDVVPAQTRDERWPALAAALRRGRVRVILWCVALLAVAMAIGHWRAAGEGTWGVGRAGRRSMGIACALAAAYCAWVLQQGRSKRALIFLLGTTLVSTLAPAPAAAIPTEEEVIALLKQPDSPELEAKLFRALWELRDGDRVTRDIILRRIGGDPQSLMGQSWPPHVFIRGLSSSDETVRYGAIETLASADCGQPVEVLWLMAAVAGNAPAEVRQAAARVICSSGEGWLSMWAEDALTAIDPLARMRAMQLLVLATSADSDPALIRRSDLHDPALPILTKWRDTQALFAGGRQSQAAAWSLAGNVNVGPEWLGPVTLAVLPIASSDPVGDATSAAARRAASEDETVIWELEPTVTPAPPPPTTPPVSPAGSPLDHLLMGATVALFAGVLAIVSAVWLLRVRTPQGEA